MKRLYYIILFFCLCPLLTFCKTDETKPEIPEEYQPFDVSYTPFDIQIDDSFYQFDYVIPMQNYIPEASGIVEGRVNPNKYFTHNDRGHANFVYLFGKEGDRLGQFRMVGAGSIDYEDISNYTDADGKHYIYVGDIGDNPLNRRHYNIYVFEEPDASNLAKGFNEDINEVEKVRYYFPDPEDETGHLSYDTEAMFVEPGTNDIYLFTKSPTNSYVYRVNYPFDDEMNEAEYLGRIRISGEKVTAADISADGKKVILKTYETVFEWSRTLDTPITNMLQTTPTRLPYIGEVQGEAICYLSTGGYITVSEIKNSVLPQFYFYKEK